MVAAQRAGHEVVGGAIENGNPKSLIAWVGYLGEFREWVADGTGSPGEPRADVQHLLPALYLHPLWRLSHYCIAICHIHRSAWRGYLAH
jgi:hypothetical protein